MNINIFQIKKNIKFLPNDRVCIKNILFLLIIYIISFFSSFFLLDGGIFKDFIWIIQIASALLNDIHGAEKTNVLFNIIRDMSFLFLLISVLSVSLFIFLNWLIKRVLRFFKKEISLYKLINLSIYSILVKNFLFFLLIIFILPFIGYVFFKFLFFTFIFIIPFLSLVLFIYGIKISIKNNI